MINSFIYTHTNIKSVVQLCCNFLLTINTLKQCPPKHSVTVGKSFYSYYFCNYTFVCQNVLHFLFLLHYHALSPSENVFLSKFAPVCYNSLCNYDCFQKHQLGAYLLKFGQVISSCTTEENDTLSQLLLAIYLLSVIA